MLLLKFSGELQADNPAENNSYIIAIQIHYLQKIPCDNPDSTSVPLGEEDKNRFANVLPRKYRHFEE